MEQVRSIKFPTLNQLIALAAVIVAALALWTFADKFNRPEPGVSAPLPPAKEARGVDKVRTEVRVVYVYPDKLKQALDLPAPVQSDAAKQVLATGKLKAEARDYTLSAVLDTQTGQGEVYARPDPLPWMGPGRQAAVGVGYGLKSGQPAGWIQARHDLVQVKALHAGALGMVFTDGEWVAGGYVEWRF